MAERDDRVLEVNALYKRFARTIPARRRQLVRQFTRAIRGRPDDAETLAPDEFWSLEDVSFSLHRGEALGLIGLNGAGKSTLLSIIARQLLPDRGKVRSRGEIAAMINLTAGFEESLTGRENVFLKGALLGRSRRQMQDRFDEIVAFSDIGDFLDSPVGTYSSGMRMRLAFSVAVHTEPDLLLIDEVLSVGDFKFRQKCLRKLNELRTHASFIFVSHSLGDLARFCSRLVVLDKGKLEFNGPVSEGLEFYTSRDRSYKQELRNDSAVGSSDLMSRAPLGVMGEFLHREEDASFVSFAWASNGEGNSLAIKPGRGLVADLVFRIESSYQDVVIGIPIWNEDSVLVTGVSSENDRIEMQPGREGRVKLQIRFDLSGLNPGTYYPVLSISRNSEVIFRQPVEPFVLEITERRTWGVYTPFAEWRCVNQSKREESE